MHFCAFWGDVTGYSGPQGLCCRAGQRPLGQEGCDGPHRETRVSEKLPLGLAYGAVGGDFMLMNQHYVLSRMSLNRSPHTTRFCMDWLMKMLWPVFPLRAVIRYLLVQCSWGLHSTELPWITVLLRFRVTETASLGLTRAARLTLQTGSIFIPCWLRRDQKRLWRRNRETVVAQQQTRDF